MQLDGEALTADKKAVKKPSKSAVLKATQLDHQLTLEEYFKKQEELNKKEAEDEKEKICMALQDEVFPNFLTKLGLITKMIQDVTQFRIRLKRSRSRMNDQPQENRPKLRKGGEEQGLSVEATEAIWKMKKKGKLEDMELSAYKKPLRLHKSKTNKLGNKRRTGAYFKRTFEKDKLVRQPLPPANPF